MDVVVFSLFIMILTVIAAIMHTFGQLLLIVYMVVHGASDYLLIIQKQT